MTSIYDEPDFLEDEPKSTKPKKARKKTVVKKPATKKTVPKKKPQAKKKAVEKQPVKKKVIKKKPVKKKLVKKKVKKEKVVHEPMDVATNPEAVLEHKEIPETTVKPTEVHDEPKEKTPAITPEDFFASVKPVPEYIKHLIECRCELAQFRTMEDPPNHKFIVFSELDERGDVKHSYVQCNNCGIIHKVIEFNESQTIKKESLMSMENIEDIKLELPDWLTAQLEKYDCDIHVWQEARFILKHGLWGRFVLLSKEREDSTVFGKICQILGKELYKIEVFEQDENDLEVSF